MHAALPQLEVSERRRRSFRLLTFLAAVVATFAALLVTSIQTPALLEIMRQTETWWWRFLGIPAVITPALIGGLVIVGFALYRLRRRRRGTTGAMEDPLDKATVLERIGWRLTEVYLVLFPLTVALLPVALRVEELGVLSQSSYHIVAMYSMVATLLSSVALSGLRRWSYVALIQVVTAMTFLSATKDPAVSGLFMLYSLALSLPTMAASLTMQQLAFAVDEARALDEQREGSSALLAARLTEANRIDTLIHDHILSALLLASRASRTPDPAVMAEEVAAVRKHASAALDTLDDIARPQEAQEMESMSPAAFQNLLKRQVHALAPATTVITTGTRPTPVPGAVAHAMVAAACEAVRNSLRHSGATAADGSPVTRRVMLHFSAVGVTSTVTDDGAGFDPSTVSDRRMGVRGSILRRMKTLPGGSAQVDSSIGEGTRVSLSWVDPHSTQRASRHEVDVQRSRGVAEELLDTSLTGPTQLPGSVRRRLRPLIAAVAMLLVLTFGGMAALTIPAFSARWVGPVCVAIHLVAALVALRPHALLRSTDRVGAWMLTLATLTSVSIAASTYRGTGLTGVEMWQVVATAVTLMVLALCGFRLEATLGTVVASLVVLLAPLPTASTSNRVATVVTLVVFVLAASLVSSWVSHQVRQAARMQDERAARHVRENENIVALEARRERSRELDDLARPLLTSLAGGARLTPEIKARSAQLEAELRNSLRARCFRGTPVVAATRQAFRRGVNVDLMDDGGLDMVEEDLRLTVEQAVVREISLAQDGTVTVRVLPPGRETLLTILRRPEDGALVRTELTSDGRLLLGDRPLSREVSA